jgi:hypothetical protein
MKIMNEGERITTQGFEILIPKNCYGILSDETYSKLAEAPGSLFEEDDLHITIVHDSNNPNEYMLRKYMEEELYGEYVFDDAVSVFKIRISEEWDEVLDFSSEDDRNNSGGELYVTMMEYHREKYVDTVDDDSDYSYDKYADIQFSDRNSQSYYWFDCHDDSDVYPYQLILRLSHVADKINDRTLGIDIEAILPQQDWKKEYAYIMDHIKLHGKSIFNIKELK